ncbi:hypothetical protein PPACK8108_LOCUS9841 [Phakopsora pachyrhizi]|uniref:Uncharacterized protein n=1 Tax=Phakopsora pachyrhizi TaxID=170000 RepID=A0AAV0AXX0_PHAPC|nr:hypothetical protein PPACK8108_LOCUS9841 [Phakopsora pachyrhizi]
MESLNAWRCHLERFESSCRSERRIVKCSSDQAISFEVIMSLWEEILKEISTTPFPLRPRLSFVRETSSTTVARVAYFKYSTSNIIQTLSCKLSVFLLGKIKSLLSSKTLDKCKKWHLFKFSIDSGSILPSKMIQCCLASSPRVDHHFILEWLDQGYHRESLWILPLDQ